MDTFEVRLRQAEQAPLESQEGYQFIVDHIKEIVLILNKKGKIIFANKNTLKDFGYSKEELIGKSISHLLTAGSITKALYALAQEFLGRPQPELEVQAKTKSGEIRYLSVAEGSAPIHKNGKLMGVMISANDITGRRRAEKERQEAEKRFRDLWENAPVAYHTVDTKGIVTNANQTEANMLGYAKEELVGKSIFEFILPEQRAEAATRFQQKIFGHRISRAENRIFVKKDGSKINVAIDDSLERDEDGKVIGIRTTLVDIPQLKVAEELKKSEEHFRALVEKSGIGISTDDDKGNLRYCNSRYADIFGYSMEEMRSQPISSIVHSDDVERVMPYHRGRLQGKDVPSRYEFKGIRKDGSVIYLEVDVVVLREGERLIGTRSYMWDITERKGVEEELRKSEERFKLIFEYAPDGYYLNDLKGNFIDGNKAAENITGYKREELIGGNFLKLKMLSLDQLPKAVKLLAKNAMGMATGPDEFILKRKSGDKVAVEISTHPVKFESRTVVLGIARDITERMRSEEALRESEEKYRTLVENAAEAILIAQDGMLKFVNRMASEMTGYSEQELHSSPFLEFVHPDDRDMVGERYLRRLKGDMTQSRYAFRLINKDGSTKWVEIDAVFVAWKGKPATLNFLSDVTERKKNEEKLRQTLDGLGKALSGIFQVLSALTEKRDPYTAGHQRRVADLARAIGQEMGLVAERVEGLRLAGTIHDMGKIAIPSEILSKPTHLTEIEFNLIKVHPQVGYDILENIDFFWPIATMILQHHERMNGSGYPAQLKGEEILLEARILAVSDVVEAMASHRPYRPALGIEAALAEIEKNKGILYDSEVASACLALFREKGFKFA